MPWDPHQYLKFASERVRPAQDLVARIPLAAPATIVDLGCGTGALTALLRSRWPAAQITGIDNSQAMLERAQRAVPNVALECSDLARWAPPHAVDLIASNAALHWLDDHPTLFARLMGHLSPGGVLAVQMPAQHEAPSHRIGYDLAESEPWASALAGRVRRHPILPASEYYDLLRRCASRLDLWFTEYVQILNGPDAVAEFTKGSFVGAWLAALSEEQAQRFETTYRERVRAAYPQRADGTTLFPFRRFFIVAQR